MDNAHKSEIRNPKSEIRNPLSSWWRAILGTLLVLAGLATAIVTLMARRLGAPELASAGAIASLVFVLLIMVLVVPPLARSAFAEVAGRGLPIEVTTGGVIFVVILVIVAFAAWNTGNNLLFMVFSIMLSTIFVSWAAARAALRDLTVSARFPDHIFAGETGRGHRHGAQRETPVAVVFDPGGNERLVRSPALKKKSARVPGRSPWGTSSMCRIGPPPNKASSRYFPGAATCW